MWLLLRASHPGRLSFYVPRLLGLERWARGSVMLRADPRRPPSWPSTDTPTSDRSSGRSYGVRCLKTLQHTLQGSDGVCGQMAASQISVQTSGGKPSSIAAPLKGVIAEGHPPPEGSMLQVEGASWRPTSLERTTPGGFQWGQLDGRRWTPARASLASVHS